MTPSEKIYLADSNTPMTELLSYLGIPYRGVPSQLKCPIHKFGQETKPSARVYQENRNVWCYTCARQYKATEVYSTQKEVTRVEAAERILSKWPVSEVEAVALLKNYTAPKKKEPDKAMVELIEKRVLVYKRKVPLENYRSWLQKISEFSYFLVGLSARDGQIAMHSFLSRMDRELTGLSGGT
jgi:hypothetical protein